MITPRGPRRARHTPPCRVCSITRAIGGASIFLMLACASSLKITWPPDELDHRHLALCQMLATDSGPVECCMWRDPNDWRDMRVLCDAG